MVKHRWPQSIAGVLVHEGEFTDDPRDPGNWTGGKVNVGQLKGTKKGISAGAFPHLDIRNLTDAQINDIYKKRYWNPLQCDRLPGGVDYCTFDFGVNSGISRSAKYLQAVVGAGQDGQVGPKTLEAVSKIHPATIVKKVCARRLSFLQALSTWQTFGRGWLRRVTDVEATAYKWAVEDYGGNTDYHLEQEENQAGQSANNNGGAAVGSGGVGAGGGGMSVGDGLDLNSTADVVLAFGSLALVLVAGFFVFKFVINKSRQKSYKNARNS